MLRRKPPRRVACSLPCFAGTHCARYNLSQVEHLDPLARPLGSVVASEVRVLVSQGVEAMRAIDDYLPYSGGRERADVLLGERLEQILVAHAPGWIAGAEFARAQDGEGDGGSLQHSGHGPGDLL